MEVNKPISIIVTLAVSFTVFFLFTLPKYQETQDLEADLMQKEAQYQSRIDYYMKVADVLKMIDQKQDEIGKIESALPSGTDLSPVIYFISSKAQAAGLEVKSISFSDQRSSNRSSEERFKNVGFKVELSGSYEGLKGFMHSLENSARLFEVSSVSFTQSNESPVAQKSLQSYNFTMDIATHTY